jgi:hypothetical protein
LIIDPISIVGTSPRESKNTSPIFFSIFHLPRVGRTI